MAKVTGTFEGTGQSSTISGEKIMILLDFVGVATVKIQIQMPSGAWMDVEEVTATDKYFWDSRNGAVVTMRLDCTAHTNDVEYWMQSEL